MESTFYIRAASPEDLDDIVRINTAAFGRDEEADLVRELLADDTAKPTVSLLAFDDDAPVGHILFSRVTLERKDIDAVILAPLAVLPTAQGKQVGGRLIRTGLELLTETGTELVFVLGHPAYYPRYGFQPAGAQGFDAPYPIPPKHADVWMVQELVTGAIDRAAGKVRCADALDYPELWSD